MHVCVYINIDRIRPHVCELTSETVLRYHSERLARLRKFSEIPRVCPRHRMSIRGQSSVIACLDICLYTYINMYMLMHMRIYSRVFERHKRGSATISYDVGRCENSSCVIGVSMSFKV